MLHAGIFKNYVERRANSLSQADVETIAVSETEAQFNQGAPTIASASSVAFLNNPVLTRRCSDLFTCYPLQGYDRDDRSGEKMEGQLPATLMATGTDIQSNQELVEEIKNIVVVLY